MNANAVPKTEMQSYAREVSAEILRLMSVEAKADAVVDAEDGQIWVNVQSAEAGRLIGRGAQTLEALQYLVNLLVRRKFREDPRILVDIDGYRARQVAQMTRQALDAADLVRTNGRSYTFDPLNPSERRAIHRALLKATDIETLSGPPDARGRKRVTVRLKNAPNPQDVAAQNEDLVEEGDSLVE